MPAPVAAGHKSGPSTDEAVRCIRLGELRGVVPISYVALQDTRHGHSGGKPFRLRFDAARRRPRPVGVPESGPSEPPKPRLLDRVRHRDPPLRPGHREAYVHWTKRYVFFHGKRHLAEMGAGPDYHAPRTDQMSRGDAPYIIALGLGGVLHGKMSVHRLRRIHSP